MDSSDDGYDEIPDFEVDAQPFMEFRLYYKSARLLHSLGIKEPQRNLYGEGPAFRKERIDLPVKAPLSSMGLICQVRSFHLPEVMAIQHRLS